MALALALLLLAAPAVAQTVTVDLGALDRARPRRPRLSVQLPALVQVDAPSAPLQSPALPSLVRRPSDALRALLPPRADAILALPPAEPPRGLRVRETQAALLRFAAGALSRRTPFAPVRIEPAPMPALDVPRLLLIFAPALDAPSPRDPVVLREAMTPVLAALDPVPRFAALEVPQVAIATSLRFTPAGASLDDAGCAALERVADALDRRMTQQARLVVALPAGDDPDAARRLALARMSTVRAYLLARGIAASRLVARATVAQHGAETVRIALD